MTFPAAAMQFYAELRLNNSREFWAEHKPRYEADVRAPIEQVAAGLADEFGEAKVYRPYRDLRFRKDKTPYKTHQGAHIRCAPGCGWYTEVNADEFVAGGGFYHAGPEGLAAIRAAIDDEHRGAELIGIIDELTANGWQVFGERVKTAPRGYTVRHPRIELLRHKSLFVLHEIEPHITGVDAATGRIAELWRQTSPLVAWQAEVLRTAT